MRKFGRILFCFVPFLLAFGIQMLLTVPFMGISLAYVVRTSGSNTDIYELLTTLMQTWTNPNFNTWLSLVYGVSALIVFFIWYQKRFHTLRFKDVSYSANPMVLTALICLVVGLQHLTSYVVSIVAAINPLWLEHYQKMLEAAGFSEVTPILALYSVLIGPICEELIFRGVTLGYAKREMPFWAANLLQAFIFGIFHMNVIQGVYAFFIGLFFGYVCLKGGIYVSILLHILFNAWGTFVQNDYMSSANTVFFFIFWLVLGIVFTWAGVLLFRKGIQKLEIKAKDSYNISDI